MIYSSRQSNSLLMVALAVVATWAAGAPSTCQEKEQAAKQAKVTLPKLKVLVVDQNERPIEKAGVLLYDRNHYMAGKPVDFEKVFKRSDSGGLAELGRLPQDFVCVQVNGGGNEKLAALYCVIYANSKNEFLQTNPAHPLVELSQSDDVLTMTFRLGSRVPIEFEVIDQKTSKPVWWPEIYMHETRRNRWWMVSLIDGGGQHEFSPILPSMLNADFHIAARGYYPADFKLSKLEEIKRDDEIISLIQQSVKLKPAPDLKITVRDDQGEPIRDALIRWDNPKGLEDRISAKTGESGSATVKYPKHHVRSSLRIVHDSESATAPVESFLDGKIRTMLSKNKVKFRVLIEHQKPNPDAK